jgi:protein-disulfide isomerase
MLRAAGPAARGPGRSGIESRGRTALIKRIGVAAAFVLGLAAATPAFADEPGITQSQATQILDELKQIHQLLEQSLKQQAARPAAPAPAPDRNVTLPPVTAYKLGRDDAPLTLVEFTDFQCPYCRQYHISTFEQLKKEFIDTGKVRYVSRDLPLDFHKNAFAAANAARCAGEQGKYWELRHAMIVNADQLDPEKLVTYAADLGIDTTRFGACMQSQKYAPAIRKDLADAQAAGVSATPSFVLGRSTKSGAEGVLIVGAAPLENFESRIHALLDKK